MMYNSFENTINFREVGQSAHGPSLNTSMNLLLFIVNNCCLCSFHWVYHNDVSK